MASRVFVENLPPDITEERLKDIFAQIGDVQSVTIKTDLLTRLTRGETGCGFVDMSLDVDAYRAVHCLEGAMLKDRKIHVEEVRPLLDRAKEVIAQSIVSRKSFLARVREKLTH